MPRKPRIEAIGYHHIINRGVARGDIFLKDADNKKFLEILEEAKVRYHFIVHSFCLMRNHYHLLIETKDENLSLLARQINSKYAQYFNREYNRVGPLWQGRFKNSFVYDNSYLAILFKYIEQNPVKAKIVSGVGKYRWSSSFCVLNGLYDDLIKGSLLYDKSFFNTLSENLTDEELGKLKRLEKTKYKQDEKTVRLRQNSLEFYFNDINTKAQRDEQIFKAIIDGYKQSEIADFLKLSRTTISKTVKEKQQSFKII